jgi:predicted SAM-dependent methyltransferase
VARLNLFERIDAYRLVRSKAGAARDRLRRSAYRTRSEVHRYLAREQVAKLHIGCGDHFLDGWLNTEFDARLPSGAIFLDAVRPFPFPSDSFDLIFSEHMIEHVPFAGARSMLRECHRVLKRTGRIRISTPRLEFLAELLTDPTDDHDRYLRYHFNELSEPDSVRSRAGVVNDYHRLWGHQFIYDEPTLRHLLSECAFVGIERVPLGQSSIEDLRGLDNEKRMPPGLLALTTMAFEAMKPNA